jgi:hypothetical protein
MPRVDYINDSFFTKCCDLLAFGRSEAAQFKNRGAEQRNSSEFMLLLLTFFLRVLLLIRYIWILHILLLCVVPHLIMKMC